MQRFKWKTLSVDRRYMAESPLGVLLIIERATTDKPFKLSIGSMSMRLTTASSTSAAHAKRRAEKVYCTLIRNEWKRVCK